MCPFCGGFDAVEVVTVAILYIGALVFVTERFVSLAKNLQK